MAHAEQAVAAAQAKQEAEEDKAEEASASNSVELAEMKFEFESLKQQHEVMTDDLAKAVSSAQESKSAFEESTATLQEQLKTLQQEVVELQGAKAGSESEVATAQHKLAQVEAGVEKTMGLLCTKSGRVKTLEKEAVAMRASLTEFEMRLEETEGDVVEQTRARADSRAVSITAKAEATESLAQVNSVCREQAATISQLQVEVAELQAATEQIDGAMQLERSRVEQLEKDVNDGSKLTEGYRKAFEAMVENEQVSEGDVINKTRQIAVLQAEIALLEIKVRWGEQRRSLSVMAQAGDCSLSGEIKHHFEVEVWHKSRLGSKFGRSRWKPELNQSWRDVSAPEGGDWNGEWQIDGNHTAVDQDGWSYGRSEQELSDRRQGNVSQSEKGPDDVFRTRKWLRAAVAAGAVAEENLGFDQCGSTPKSQE